MHLLQAHILVIFAAFVLGLAFGRSNPVPPQVPTKAPNVFQRVMSRVSFGRQRPVESVESSTQATLPNELRQNVIQTIQNAESSDTVLTPIEKSPNEVLPSQTAESSNAVLSPIGNLPTEMLQKVFESLPVSDAAALGATSKKMHDHYVNSLRLDNNKLNALLIARHSPRQANRPLNDENIFSHLKMTKVQQISDTLETLNDAKIKLATYPLVRNVFLDQETLTKWAIELSKDEKGEQNRFLVNVFYNFGEDPDIMRSFRGNAEMNEIFHLNKVSGNTFINLDVLKLMLHNGNPTFPSLSKIAVKLFKQQVNDESIIKEFFDREVFKNALQSSVSSGKADFKSLKKLVGAIDSSEFVSMTDANDIKEYLKALSPPLSLKNIVDLEYEFPTNYKNLIMDESLLKDATNAFVSSKDASGNLNIFARILNLYEKNLERIPERFKGFFNAETMTKLFETDAPSPKEFFDLVGAIQRVPNSDDALGVLFKKENVAKVLDSKRANTNDISELQKFFKYTEAYPEIKSIILDKIDQIKKSVH